MKVRIKRSLEPHSWQTNLLLLAAALPALFFSTMVTISTGAEGSFCTVPGPEAGQCANPRGAATDFETGRVYVADQGNNRIDVFKADGSFVMAFGWGVADGTTAALQTCGPEASPPTPSCFKGISGAGAGQLSSPAQIAVDNIAGSSARHDIYVDGSFRMQRFHPDGSFALAFGWGVDTGASELQGCTAGSGCQAGLQGAGKCQLWQSNSPVAVGPAGDIFVSDASGNEPNFTDRVEKFSPSGACLDETVVVKGNHRQVALAVDSNEDAYVSDERGNSLRKYDLSSPETELCALDPDLETNALAIDDTGHLFASQREKRVNGAGNFQVVAEYGSACEALRRFGYGEIHSNLVGMGALHGAGGDVFAGESEIGGGVHYLKIPPPGPIALPESVEANPIGNVRATLNAEINPEGLATSAHFDYIDDASYQTAVEQAEEEGKTPGEAAEAGFEGVGAKSTAVLPLSVAAGKEFRVNIFKALVGCPTASKKLIEEGKCLTPETVYHYRIIATNADNPSGGGAGTVVGAFETKDPLQIEETWASEVGTDIATINTTVNPLGIPANGYFEYVSDAQFKAGGFAEATRVPAPEEIDFGSTETGVKHAFTLFPLPEATTYHYRVVVFNPLVEGSVMSEARTFRTLEGPGGPETCSGNEAFRAGPSASLPDCRAYEMVSPLDKAGESIRVGLQSQPSQRPAAVQRSAVSGDRFTYGARRAFGDAKSSPFTSQYVATRHPLGSPEEGWSSHGITPAYGKAIGGKPEFDYEFRAFSPDLCQSWITPFFDPVLAEEATPGYVNLYRRQDGSCGGVSYETLTTTPPEYSNSSQFHLELQGLSADGTVAVFEVNDNLSADSAAQPASCVSKGEGCGRRLYAKRAGSPPRFLCILPNGQASKTQCSAGTGTSSGFPLGHAANVKGAVSVDGTKVFWSASDGEGKIYLRENPFGEGVECADESSPCTIAVSQDAEALSKTSASHFWLGASDGSRAIFSTGVNSTGGDLYEFDVETETTERIAGGFLGVLGASEDASRVYFASSEVLTGEEENGEHDKALPGKANLYLREAGAGSGSYRFVATLANADVRSATPFTASSATAFEPGRHNGRVSPDGMHAAFMSTAPLTGYDNTDAASPTECGRPKGICDTEAFLYDAGAGGKNQLICASCNPGEGRPAGGNVAEEGGDPFWVGARIPVLQNTLYDGRLLADDGSRLYFESQDALVATDTNGRLDVYQWEEPGVGSCKESKPTFVASAHGCIDLISSGKSLRDSEFIDASPGGQDVFFNTLSSLVPQDYGLVDVYDARVDGGFPAPPAPPSGCEGGACQAPPGAPNDPTPASASFAGAGNVHEGPSSSCRKGKTRRNGRCVAKKHKHAHKRHQSRANRHRGAER